MEPVIRVPPHTVLTRQCREPISVLTVSALLGFGVVGVGTGISSLILSNSRYQELSATIDADVQRLQQGVDDLSGSFSSLTEVALQNRRGLDLLSFYNREDSVQHSKKNVASMPIRQE